MAEAVPGLSSEGENKKIRFFDMSKMFLQKLRSVPETFDELKKKFVGRKSTEELFTNIWDLEEAHLTLSPTLEVSEKSELKAIAFGREGNKCFEEKRYSKALEFYSKSILASPHPLIRDAATASDDAIVTGDEKFQIKFINPQIYGGVTYDESGTLAKGYYNRSSLLKELKLYESSISDIDLALKYNHPKASEDELEHRRAKCQASLQKGLMRKKQQPPPPTAELFQTRQQPGPDPPLNDMMKLLNLACEPDELPALEVMMARSRRNPPQLKEHNPSVPSFSNSLKVVYDPSKGRHVVAAKKIRPGEVIVSERAVTVSIEADKLSLFCSYCLRFTVAPVPCPACTWVLYCSESCRTQALAEDHWLECKLVPSMITLELTGINLIFKMLKNFSYGDLKQMVQEIKEENIEDQAHLGCDSQGIFTSTSYHTIYHMFAEHRLLRADLLFMQCQLAFVVTKLLQLSERFFLDSEGKPFTPTREDFIQTGAILLSNLVKMNFNLQFTSDMQTNDQTACGIFPATSLFNHSCVPSAKKYSIGRTMIILALRPIEAGEEVTIAYVDEYVAKERELRRKQLEKYKFQCTCEACENMWPIYPYLSLLELKEEISCERRRNVITDLILGSLGKAYNIEVLIRTSPYLKKDDLDNLRQANELLHKFLKRDTQNIHDIQDILFKGFRLGTE